MFDSQWILVPKNNKVLFKQYRIALKRDKDAIYIDGEDATNRNRLFFDFMLRMFDHLNKLYEMEKSLLIDTILEYHLRKESTRKIHQNLLHQGNILLSKIQQSLLLNKVVLRTRLTELFKQIVTPIKQI